MSNLVDKYGCQKMTMIGGVFGCVGFVLSAFSNSIEMMFVTFGLIAGLGRLKILHFQVHPQVLFQFKLFTDALVILQV